MAKNYLDPMEEHDSTLYAKRVTIVGANATINAVVNTSAAGQSSVVLDTGSKWVGLATVNVGNLVNIGNFSGSTIYAVVNTSAAGQSSVVLDTGTKWIGLATAFVSNANLVGAGKTLNTSPIALNATNLSGATIFVSASAKKFYITDLFLSTASAVGVAFNSDATYLSGNASIRASFAPQSGLVNHGSPESPLMFGLAAEKPFQIITDTAAPVSGSVIWFEE